MRHLKASLIRLGALNPKLRRHIRPVLSNISHPRRVTGAEVVEIERNGLPVYSMEDYEVDPAQFEKHLERVFSEFKSQAKNVLKENGAVFNILEEALPLDFMFDSVQYPDSLFESDPIVGSFTYSEVDDYGWVEGGEEHLGYKKHMYGFFVATFKILDTRERGIRFSRRDRQEITEALKSRTLLNGLSWASQKMSKKGEYLVKFYGEPEVSRDGYVGISLYLNAGYIK